MAAVRSADTKPEMIVRRGLHARGLRYRLHDRRLPGKPDLVFPSSKAVVFVNGCFWHAHRGCRYFKLPETNRRAWLRKLAGNRRRDRHDHLRLRVMGWRVIVVWECELRGKQPEVVKCFLDRLALDITHSQPNR